MAKDYYGILGVPSHATGEEIKAAFRRRALELHPDRSGLERGPFQEVQEAYDVLSDPERRRKYDRQRKARKQRPTARRAPRKSRAEPLIPRRARPEPFAAPTGGTRRPPRPVRALCPRCGGGGEILGHICPWCAGRGEIIVLLG
jgi:DnaJ-class molecular chaperone